MPRRPAASRTANVRDGLQAESGERTSTRADWALPGLYEGSRTSAERLARPQVAAVGASVPASRRRYEFTVWLVTAVPSLAWASRPAMNCLPVVDRRIGSAASWKA